MASLATQVSKANHGGFTWELSAVCMYFESTVSTKSGTGLQGNHACMSAGDGAKMANDTFKGVGYCAAFLTGWILERRFVKFSTDISMMRRMTRLTVGLLSYYVVSLIFVPAVKGWISGAPGTFVSCYLQVFYVSFIFPWLIKRFEKS